jgi:hypothetical protein
MRLEYAGLTGTAILLALVPLWLGADGPPGPHAPVRIACVGEQLVHSYHRENDPEYPQFLGELLDADFKAEPTPHPMQGGFLYGGGSRFRIGNFGHPRGTVIDHGLENPKAILRSGELRLAERFAPDIVVLGPFGYHESLTGVGMDHFAPDLRRLIDRIQAFGSRPAVYVALPVPFGAKDDNRNFRRVRSETEQVARERKLPIIDLWSAFLGHDGYFKDGFHLTESGRRHLARVVADAISRQAAAPAAAADGVH